MIETKHNLTYYVVIQRSLFTLIKIRFLTFIEFASKAGVVADNLHHHSTQTVKVASVNQHPPHVEVKGSRSVATNSTSTSTFIDYLNSVSSPTTPGTSLVTPSTSVSTVGTQYTNSHTSAAHFHQDHHKSTLLPRAGNLLPSSASSPSVNSGLPGTDIRNRVAIKKEVSDANSNDAKSVVVRNNYNSNTQDEIY